MKIDGFTRTCGLIGNPVEHTMSPVIHNTLSDRLGQNIRYVPFHVNDGLLEDAIKGAWALNLLGLNVTVPYKSDVIPFLCEIDPLAAKIGAVNALVRTEAGYKGYNTDMPGLYRAMCEDGVLVEGQDVILLGAGGVARAVAMLFVEKNAASVTILNRTTQKAEQVAAEVNKIAERALVHVLPMCDFRKLSGRKYLVIQATSVGMSPHTDASPVEDEEFYDLVHTGYDLIFNPLETKFMKQVRAHGGKAYCGYKMLLYQGIIAYEYWTGRKVDDALAAEVYRKMLESMKESNIILIGFMGCGKTTVGKILSEKMSIPIEDTDKLIEAREKQKISEIFRTQGEEYFRMKETELLEELAAESGGLILSVGGGTPVREENRTLLKQCGTVVYLRVRPETVWERLRGDTSRPLLACEDPKARIKELLESRKEAYEECADLVIDADEMQIDEICGCIIESLSNGGKI